ncbi:MAG: hypothetical protein IM631_05435 [Cytophagales bacterium]|nr:hypothetical protein [Cytophagales bacterium]MCA6370824.1 hypothetical protein [Cytophagales bacterium]MCA6375734.1 hypothetical protein [Cytophagales bacterium]MCA6384685.1 hypothetical protein [Cytophagales bacterium]
MNFLFFNIFNFSLNLFNNILPDIIGFIITISLIPYRDPVRVAGMSQYLHRGHVLKLDLPDFYKANRVSDLTRNGYGHRIKISLPFFEQTINESRHLLQQYSAPTVTSDLYPRE